MLRAISLRSSGFVVVCAGRYCEEELRTAGLQNGWSGGLVALVVVVALLAVLVILLVLLLLLRVRSRRKHSGTYRPSVVEHKAGTLPLPTVAASSASTTPLRLVLGHTKHEVLV